jgi:hypothetical protein
MEILFKCLSCGEGELVKKHKFLECSNCGKKFKITHLKRGNDIKYCRKCGKINQIVVLDLIGYCVDCGEVLYTLESEKRKRTHIDQA